MPNRLRALLASLLLAAACSSAGEPNPTSPNTPNTPANPGNPGNPSAPTGPFNLTAVSGATQGGPAGVVLDLPLTVRVANAAGPVAGITVTWTAASGTLTAATSVTNAAGDATNGHTLAPVLGAQMVTATVVGATAPVTFTGSVVVTTFAFTVETAALDVDEELTLTSAARDSRGTEIPGGTVTLVTRDAAVATTPAAGKVRGVADGLTWAVSQMQAGGPTLTDSVRIDVYSRLRGRVFTHDDAPPPALRAYSTNNGVTDSTNVAADGTFSLRLSTHLTATHTELLVDAVEKSNRAHFPALLPIVVRCATTPFCVNSSVTAEHRFVLVPRQYTVTRGAYLGRVLAVNLDSAMATPVKPGNTGPAYLHAAGGTVAAAINGLPPNHVFWTHNDGTWSPDSFPIAAAMHPTDGKPISASDSIAVWQVLNDIEAALGYDIWTPVARNPAWNLATAADQTAVPRRTFLFTFNSTNATAGSGGTGRRILPEAAAELLGNQDFNPLGWRGVAVHNFRVTSIVPTWQNVVIKDPASITNRELLMHETMHALSVGHGCNWVSTQSYCGYRAPDDKPTFEDAAYLLLAMELKRQSIRKQAPHSWATATLGYRAIMRGLPPILDMTTLPAAVLLRR